MKNKTRQRLDNRRRIWDIYLSVVRCPQRAPRFASGVMSITSHLCCICRWRPRVRGPRCETCSRYLRRNGYDRSADQVRRHALRMLDQALPDETAQNDRHDAALSSCLVGDS